MLNNNQPLNNQNLNNQNLNNGGIELGPIREVQYVVPQAQLHVVEQNRPNDNRINFKFKFIRDLIVGVSIIILFAFSIYNYNNITKSSCNCSYNDTGGGDTQSVSSSLPFFSVESNNNLKTVKLHNPDNSVFSFVIKNGTNGINGRDGIDGLPGRDGIDGIDGLPGRDGLDGLKGMDATCKSAGFPVIENDQYSKLKLATGVDYIGLGYDPITDTHGANFFDPSFSEMKVVTDPIDGESHKNYDYINRYDHNFKHNVIASASTYRDINMYRNSKTNGAGGSVGFSSFLSASASTSKTKAMTSLSEGNKVVIEYTMMNKLYEITAEQDLTNYVKSEYVEAVDNLPDYDKNDNSIVNMYDHLSYLYKDFVVTFVGLGGMITQQSIVSNANKYYSKYSSENIEGGVSGGWGPFSGSVSASTNTYSSSLDSELKSDITTNVFVSGGNAKGDLDSPSESISNIANWGDVEWQSYYDRTEKSPTKISERVIPVWYLLKGDNQKKMRDYLEDKYGTEKQDIYSMTSYFNDELSRIEDGFKNKQDDLEKKILGISVPNKAAIKWYPRNFAICGNDINCDDRNQRGKNWYYKDRPYPSRNSGTKLCNSDELMESFEYSHGYLITCWRPEIVLS